MPTKTVVINSKLRSSGTFNSFTYDLSKQIDNVNYIIPYKVHLYHTEPTINSNNKFLNFTHSTAINYTAVMTEGTYTEDELATEVQTQMNDAVPINKTYIVSYSALTTIFTISLTGTFEMDCSGSTSIGYTLGFSKNSYAYETSHKADGAPNMSADYYEVRASGLISNETHTASGTYKSVCLINIVAPDNSLIYEMPSIIERLDPVGNTIDEIDIQLYNSNGQLAQIKKDWLLILKVDYSDYSE